MSLPAAYFDELYARAQDPWGFADRWYEQRKRALTLAMLPAARYAFGFEPGCSLGVLTAELAGRCDALLATDPSVAAVRSARDRCAGLPHVEVAQGQLPADWPAAAVDLVVLSEVGYYLAPSDLDAVAQRAMSSAATVVAVHWRHPVADYPQTGDAVHRALAEAARSADMHRIGGYSDADLRAEVWAPEPRSVAAIEGLV